MKAAMKRMVRVAHDRIMRQLNIILGFFNELYVFLSQEVNKALNKKFQVEQFNHDGIKVRQTLRVYVVMSNAKKQSRNPQ